jgi:hypothetical protein
MINMEAAKAQIEHAASAQDVIERFLWQRGARVAVALVNAHYQ